MYWVFYVVTVVITLSSHEFFMYWILLEVNIVRFLTLMFFLDREKPKFEQDLLFYFCIQSLGSLIILSSSALTKIPFGENFILFVGLTLKLGLAPLAWWYIKIGKRIGNIVFTAFITFQKLPIIFYFFSWDESLIMPVLFLNAFVGVIIIYRAKDLKRFLLGSRMYRIIWMYILYQVSIRRWAIFYATYTLSVFLVVVRLDLSDQSDKTRAALASLVFLAGLPPFPSFFFKTLIIKRIELYSPITLYVLWFTTFVATISYVIFFTKIISKADIFKTSPNSKIIPLIFFVLCFLFLF